MPAIEQLSCHPVGWFSFVEGLARIVGRRPRSAAFPHAIPPANRDTHVAFVAALADCQRG